jgi:large subunit ribosomal protein L33|tara:strand:- start:292 stop:462 length:171 start_codon:yes stop_codon:yes gene_type:complete
MARDTIILECTVARKEGKQPSRYMTSRNKKLQGDPVEKMKYNRFLRKHTLHKEIKS